MRAVLVPNIVESNGKTVRENNLRLTHNIPIGTLVEVDCDYSDSHGVRMFVGDHGRDCDGTPLYGLYHSSDLSTYQYVKQHNPDIAHIMINGSWSEDALKIVAPLEQSTVDR